jgi:rod shape-determining protein MreC
MSEARRTLATGLVLLITGVALVAITSGRTMNVGVRGAVSGTVSGIQRIFAGIGDGVSNTVRSVRELRRLQEDYEAVLVRMERYQRLQGTVQELEQENARLREQLEFAARVESPVVAAEVIAKEGGPLFRSFTINRGRRHGLETQQPVVAYVDGTAGLVGRIIDVTGGTSIVLPIFAPESYVAARLQQSRHDGLIAGTGRDDGFIEMNYVPQSARNDIRYGDIVVTSGLNSVFPPEIPIGRVSNGESPAYTSTLVMRIQPTVDFSRVEYVFVYSEGVER